MRQQAKQDAISAAVADARDSANDDDSDAFSAVAVAAAVDANNDTTVSTTGVLRPSYLRLWIDAANDDGDDNLEDDGNSRRIIHDGNDSCDNDSDSGGYHSTNHLSRHGATCSPATKRQVGYFPMTMTWILAYFPMTMI
jgi:hypothetical protein